MTTTPGDQTDDPNLQPEELPDGSPSRPHGDPVMPDQDTDDDGDAETESGR